MAVGGEGGGSAASSCASCTSCTLALGLVRRRSEDDDLRQEFTCVERAGLLLDDDNGTTMVRTGGHSPVAPLPAVRSLEGVVLRLIAI